MSIKTVDEYRERVSKLKPRLFIGGKKVEKLPDHPITKGVINVDPLPYNRFRRKKADGRGTGQYI